eukprot:6205847-Pleurochrysis_carterae.AAC.2
MPLYMCMLACEPARACAATPLPAHARGRAPRARFRVRARESTRASDAQVRVCSHVDMCGHRCARSTGSLHGAGQLQAEAVQPAVRGTSTAY